ncbi:hypothetical protein N431DRAFT_60041 [Stipitochalara longipes BDJ]|nr:hypothetical protein N431DRAFT_60041 [Stipitochalara longipes BDJ]
MFDEIFISVQVCVGAGTGVSSFDCWEEIGTVFLCRPRSSLVVNKKSGIKSKAQKGQFDCFYFQCSLGVSYIHQQTQILETLELSNHILSRQGQLYHSGLAKNNEISVTFYVHHEPVPWLAARRDDSPDIHRMPRWSLAKITWLTDHISLPLAKIFSCLPCRNGHPVRPDRGKRVLSVENPGIYRGLLPTFLFSYSKIKTANDLASSTHGLNFD